MLRSLIAFLLASCSGSGLHGNTEDTAVGHNSEDSGDTGNNDSGADSGEDTGTDTADSGVEETGETGTEDTALDTAEDTGDDTATSACEFTVSTWDGDLTMTNELTIALNAASPSGASVPGTVDVLAIDFTAVHAECHDLLITGFTVEGVWSDNAGTGWYPTWVGTTVDGVLVDGTAMTIPPGRTGYAGILEAIVVPAGETVTVWFSANVSGADAVTDDSVQFNFYSGGIEVYDGSIVATLRKDRVSGMPLVF